jgi:hypothetical protein
MGVACKQPIASGLLREGQLPFLDPHLSNLLHDRLKDLPDGLLISHIPGPRVQNDVRLGPVRLADGFQKPLPCFLRIHAVLSLFVETAPTLILRYPSGITP